VLSAATAVLLVPRYGMEGAAIAGALTLGLSNLCRLALVWRHLRIQPFTLEYLRLAVPLVAGTAAAWLAHLVARDGGWQADLALTAIAGTIAYGAALVAAGLPARERRAALGLLSAVVRRAN
jgi:O-antigen/teichoic acid export membrane protein